MASLAILNRIAKLFESSFSSLLPVEAECLSGAIRRTGPKCYQDRRHNTAQGF
jgi:hypothetical protein